MRTRPNILFIFSDQHRAMDLGCYGNAAVRSPNLDRFASEAAVIDACIATCPVCVPMRGSILTGLHAWNHGALTNDLPIRGGCQGIGDVLRRNGYHTGYIGKWHLGGVPRDRSIPPEERLGFQEWKVANCTHDYSHSYYYDEGDERHDYGEFEPIGQTKLALDFIRRASRRSEDPWALFLSWGPPHAPYNDVPDEYRSLFRSELLSLRPNVGETNWDGTDQAAVREWLAGYYAHIALLDDEFARLISALDELGVSDETIVVYTSDHGDMLGSHGMTKKQLPFEEAIRVPFAVRWPGRVEPGRRGGVFGLIDVAPSLLALCGASFDGPVDGIDRSVYLRGGGEAPQSALIYNLVPCHQAADRGDAGGWVGLRTERHTYARWDAGDCFCAFDNFYDPHQQWNLCESSDLAISELVSRLDELTNRELHRIGYRVRRWQRMLIEDGYVDEWNRSQAYFNRPALIDERSPP